jgi:hypothetical protein
MPILIEEWQRFPETFDRVRRAVDAGAAASRTCNQVRREFLASRYFQVSLQGASQE